MNYSSIRLAIKRQSNSRNIHLNKQFRGTGLFKYRAKMRVRWIKTSADAFKSTAVVSIAWHNREIRFLKKVK